MALPRAVPMRRLLLRNENILSSTGTESFRLRSERHQQLPWSGSEEFSSDFRHDGYYSSEMQTKSDAQLLREYATCGMDMAFTELVHRHTNLVYSAALRQVGSPEAAAEIAQGVFIGLARGAQALLPRLTDEASLAGWLCRSTRNLSLNFRRDQFRKQSHQRKVMEQLATTSEDAPDWERLCGVLDDAMSQLNEADYDLLVLRFYKSLDYRGVGTALGLSDDAAQKRVSRALEKLRQVLSRRGIRTPAGALSLVIAANAVQAAPVGLAVTISSAALAGAASTSTIIAATKAIAMTTFQKSIFTVTVAVLAGAGIYQTRQTSQLRGQVEKLEQQQVSSDVQNQQLVRERDDLTKRLADVQVASNRPSGGMNELIRLRGEVTRLRQSAQELAQLKAAAAATGNDPAIEATLKSWATRAAQLKAQLARMPDKRIPELQLLTEKDWFDAVKNAKQFETEADFRQALQSLRDSAKQEFGNLTREALKKYAAANNGLLPPDLSQLKAFYDTPLDDAVLARYSLLQTGNLADVPGSEFLFTEKAPPVDDEYDSLYEFRMNGTRSSSVNSPGDIVWDSLAQFAKAHSGNLPGDVSQLIPYLTRPLDQAKVQEILSSIPSGISTLEQLKAAGPK
jgi:RNA polymerase sigma factor (sigma-70 family)